MNWHPDNADELKQYIDELIAEYNRIRPPEPTAHVCLGVPFNWHFQPGLLTAVMHASKRNRVSTVIVNSGCLTHAMSCLFQEFYNGREEQGYTHFGMIHSDMRPDNGWIDTLLEEADRVGADFISAAACIKDDRGLTNMGIQKPHEWNVRRITLAELYDLPETFSVKDTIYPDYWPAFNTGACVVKSGDWIHDFPGFQVRNRFSVGPNGHKRYAQFWPEDWDFTAWLHIQGLKVFTTRRVITHHTGLTEYGTDKVTGRWSRDLESIEIQMGGLDRIYPSLAHLQEPAHEHNGLAGTGDDACDSGSLGQQHIYANQ